MNDTNEHMHVTQSDINDHIAGLDAAKAAIDLAIAAQDAESASTIRQMVTHISAMCSMPHIEAHHIDIQPYLDAQRRAMSWLAHN